MPKPELPKSYNPAEYESGIYAMWEKNNAFSPAGDKSKEPFSVIMPPPNANGSLHAGHAMYVVDDIATRYNRMLGRPTLWLPGVDHAGIETQVVFERELAKQDKTRFDLGKDEFYKQALQFTTDNKHTVLEQMRSLGFSADWQKLKFTLDQDIIEIVYDTFKKLNDDGLIYRGNRIVNWCPHCHSGFADIEIKYRTQIDPLYYIKYGPFVLATVRPETKFGDTAIAVHPKDERYQDYIGQEIESEGLLGKFKLKVIADDFVDPEFGTGVVKVTPAHDPNDWEMGLRHNLEVKQVIGTDGRLTAIAGKYSGMSVDEARTQVAQDLEQAGLIDHINMNYEHSIGYHDRCGTQIEPLVIEQWWLKVDKLKKLAIDAIDKNEVVFYPARFKSQALNWLEGLRDWNISRQNWFGIAIPVYYNATGDKSKPEYIIGEEKDAIEVYGKAGYEKETDTFDTWFSSSQWPFATLQSTGDFDQYYPTSLMATMRDILYLWVTRMIMLGIYKTGEVPFKTVYLWGSVNDAEGKKMSKSKGNVLDPLELTQEFGTDALRLALVIGITPGTGGSLSQEKVQGYRNFCNKLWNVARYTLSKTESISDISEILLENPADHWMSSKLNTAITKITQSIERYNYSSAGQSAYSLLWDDLADQYIEYSKTSTNPTMLAYSLDTVLRLLHPFAPFVTEAIWQQLPWRDTILISEQWPNVYLEPDGTQAKKFEKEIISILAEKQSNIDETKIVKLKKEIATKQNFESIILKKLNNDNFVANAPKEVVDQQKDLLKSTQKEIAELKDELAKTAQH
ncbi:MAG: valyl-tRNA synthetase [Patescibacteria group bacterium]|nr:valyl-tRNA synthetase [Patescibacteria group bacterium]